MQQQQQMALSQTLSGGAYGQIPAVRAPKPRGGPAPLQPKGGSSPSYPAASYDPTPAPAPRAVRAPPQDQQWGESPTIEYDKRPRPVEFAPYTAKDYQEREYDSKQREYWTLGKLGGPAPDDEALQVGPERDTSNLCSS